MQTIKLTYTNDFLIEEYVDYPGWRTGWVEIRGEKIELPDFYITCEKDEDEMIELCIYLHHIVPIELINLTLQLSAS